MVSAAHDDGVAVPPVPPASSPPPADAVAPVPSPRPCRDPRMPRRAHRAGRKPPSAKRVAANRANARKSTGPRTVAGLRASRLNALRHGLFARVVVLLPGEDPDEYDAFADIVTDDLHPCGPIQELLADRVAAIAWRCSGCPWRRRTWPSAARRTASAAGSTAARDSAPASRPRAGARPAASSRPPRGPSGTGRPTRNSPAPPPRATARRPTATRPAWSPTRWPAATTSTAGSTRSRACASSRSTSGGCGPRCSRPCAARTPPEARRPGGGPVGL